MKISYNQLKQYINFDKTPQETAAILTSTGLEAESKGKFQSTTVNLDGIYTAKVLTKEKHPNADKLSLTTVDAGDGKAIPVVCGAPNVEAGQKVILAKIGSKVQINGKEIEIKKSKLRGEASEGMICAEDEIGLGNSHDGIIVLPDDTPIGIPAKEYFNYEEDDILEIDITPNRGDGTSHIGAARDLYAYLKFNGEEVNITKPSIDKFKVDDTSLTIPVEIENTEACKRYTGLTISGVKIAPSPQWLQNRLKVLGLTPINNVVDITNFVLHETGQPLHAFDAEKITGNKIIVKTLPEGTPFVTLDKAERKLTNLDLMICNTEEPMCIGGVMGGLESGVSAETQNIFLESAYFDSVFIRKTSKHHTLQTDASYRFERSTDPEMVLYALKRAALLIQEIAGGRVTSEIQDEYPTPFKPAVIKLQYAYVHKLIGVQIPSQDIKNILLSLEFSILEDNENTLTVEVPLFRSEVTRPADLVEEILRIYGYNNVPVAEKVNAPAAYMPKPDRNKLYKLMAEFLTSRGFAEAMSNSLTKGEYYEKISGFNSENSVEIMNPLSKDLNVLRQSLVTGMLEAAERNINYKNSDIRMYEFGKSYRYNAGKKDLSAYSEKDMLALMLCGKKQQQNWRDSETNFSFFELKSEINNLLQRLNFQPDSFELTDTENPIFAYGIDWKLEKKTIISGGLVSKDIRKIFDIEPEIFYAEINWENLLKKYSTRINFKSLPKYPAVRRDLALLADKSVSFADIRKIAVKNAKSLLVHTDVFDIFEDEKKLGKGKKSYAISFIFRDDNKTLKDKHINKIMNKIMSDCEQKLSAKIR